MDWTLSVILWILSRNNYILKPLAPLALRTHELQILPPCHGSPLSTLQLVHGSPPLCDTDSVLDKAWSCASYFLNNYLGNLLSPCASNTSQAKDCSSLQFLIVTPNLYSRHYTHVWVMLSTLENLNHHLKLQLSETKVLIIPSKILSLGFPTKITHPIFFSQSGKTLFLIVTHFLVFCVFVSF